MLAIKLKRVGKRHQPSYRVVIAEKRSKLDGRFVDDLGFYNPSSKETKIDASKVTEWMKKGAQPTDTVYNLLVKTGIIKGKKRPVHSKSKKPAEAPTEIKKATTEEVKSAPEATETQVETKAEVKEEVTVEENKEEQVEAPEKKEE